MNLLCAAHQLVEMVLLWRVICSAEIMQCPQRQGPYPLVSKLSNHLLKSNHCCPQPSVLNSVQMSWTSEGLAVIRAARNLIRAVSYGLEKQPINAVQLLSCITLPEESVYRNFPGPAWASLCLAAKWWSMVHLAAALAHQEPQTLRSKSRSTFLLVLAHLVTELRNAWIFSSKRRSSVLWICQWLALNPGQNGFAYHIIQALLYPVTSGQPSRHLVTGQCLQPSHPGNSDQGGGSRRQSWPCLRGRVHKHLVAYPGQ